MRLLLIHSDYIEYEALKQTPMAENGAILKDSLNEGLVAFCAVEEQDREDLDDVVRQAIEEIVTVARKVNTDRVMLYPYAHLSSELAPPEVAVAALQAIEKGLAESAGMTVKRAPFGWYKAFRLSCKGHPLSELSRTILPGGAAEKAEKAKVTHEFFVMTTDGELRDTKEYIDDSPFGSLLKKELGLPTPPGGEPLHVDLMRSKELVDYEQMSDVGHLRWMPRGKLIRDLLADYVLKILLPYGAMPVETPVMYDLGERAIYEHAAKFGERQYRFKSGNRDMMLRFAACFGMFSIMHGMHISPNTLPMKMYELSTYSFRHEQRGEVIGLKRLRAFTMPDMHTLCSNMDEALRCFEEQLKIGFQTGRDFEVKYVSAIRCTRDFYEKYEEWVKKVVRESGEPMLLEILSDRVHYWVAKIDLAAIDAQGRPIENPTVQIDVESSHRFDIKYYRDGEEVHPPILHCSPTGSVERVICALLENTGAQKVPQLPTWLSPTQVRFVPVADRHIPIIEEFAATMNDAGIRADIDDREESMNRKVRSAGMDWVPYIAVIGDREAETGMLTVTVRRLSEPNKPKKVEMTLEDLVKAIRKETEGMPCRPLYTPRKLSAKPRFI
jgi:threonyl-tRNA synthetase